MAEVACRSFFIYCFMSLTACAALQDWEAPLSANLERMADILTTSLKPWPVPKRTFKLTDYGAIGDGVTLNTAAIQHAIDACAESGGGTVLVEKGSYLTGTFDMKSGVMLEVAKGASILGSTNYADYPPRIPKRQTVMDTWMKLTQSLIYAEECHDIGICGEGVIDGRGTRENFPGKNGIGAMPNRPFLIRMVDCRDIVMDGITLRDAASWMQNYLNCDNLILQGMHVSNLTNWNNDAFDIDGCRNVIVRRCVSVSVDDGLCFKGAGLRTMKNVLVEDSEFRTPCNAIKFGTDSQGGFRNVLIRNVTIGGTLETTLHKRHTAISGISLQSVDGGALENILMTNIVLERADSPFCLRLGNRGRVMPSMPKPLPGTIRHIVFEHIKGGGNGGRGSIISGIPGAKIQGVAFRDIQLAVSGGGTSKDANRRIPELVDAYPDAFSFGPAVPAYGFWIRHAEGVTFDGVRIDMQLVDARPEFALENDTQNIRSDGALLNVSPPGP